MCLTVEAVGKDAAQQLPASDSLPMRCSTVLCESEVSSETQTELRPEWIRITGPLHAPMRVGCRS